MYVCVCIENCSLTFTGQTKLCQPGARLELSLAVAIHHKFMHSLQAAVTKITIMTTAKRFSGAPTKRLQRMEKATTLRMDPGYVHKMFNTIKRAAENDRE